MFAQPAVFKEMGKQLIFYAYYLTSTYFLEIERINVRFSLPKQELIMDEMLGFISSDDGAACMQREVSSYNGTC